MNIDRDDEYVRSLGLGTIGMVVLELPPTTALLAPIDDFTINTIEVAS